MKHAAGIARLMQFRGPRSHANEFDHAMLVAFRGIIVCLHSMHVSKAELIVVQTLECLFNGKPCFLAENEWREVSRLNFNQCVPDYLHKLFQDFSHYMASMPELLRDGFDVRTARKLGNPLPFSPEEISTLANRGLDLYLRLREWGSRFVQIVPYPKEGLSVTEDPVFPVVFRYESSSAATVYCSYWACIILLQEILSACRCYPDDVMGDEELVSNICKSVEFNSAGTWGPYRMGFSLRIAWEIATPPVKEWIAAWHKRFNETYAATSPLSLSNSG
jgi:hypothetical protein